MSNGIEVMKEKIRKKMTLDDLPSPKQPNTSEENVNVHLNAVQPYSNTAVHLHSNTDVQPHSNTAVQQNGSGRKKKGVVGDVAVQTVIHQNIEVDERLAQNNGEQEDLHADVQPYSNTAVQQNGFAEIERGESSHNALERTATQQTVPMNQDFQTEALGILKKEEAKIINAENKHSNSLQQQNSNTVKHQNSDVIHYNSNTAIRQNDNPLTDTNQIMEQQNSKTAVQQNSKLYNNEEPRFQHPVEQQNSNTVIHQNTVGSFFNNQMIEKNKTVYGRKMTLYLTEEMYKAFNDIYAKRMLEGRKTEKSALICEAVELLRKHENQ
jgi:hypothetical protein